MTATFAIELTDVSLVRGRTTILNGATLHVQAGETIALMGPNGAGKSTLLKLLAGALRNNSGLINWLFDSQTNTVVPRHALGFVGHDTGLYRELTVFENLRFAARMHRLSRSTERADSLIREAGIESIAHYPVAKLSQGMRRRVAILRAVVHEPLLILLDEPFAGLDTAGSEWLQGYFARWQNRGVTVCFVSHDLPLSRRLADRIVCLRNGRIMSIEQADKLRMSLTNVE